MIVVYKHVYHHYTTFINTMYTLKYGYSVYKELHTKLSNESYRPNFGEQPNIRYKYLYLKFKPTLK